MAELNGAILDDFAADAPPDMVSLDAVYPPPLPPPAPAPALAPRPTHPAVLQLSDREATRLMTQLREHYDEATSGREQNQERRALRYRRYLADVSLRDGLQPWDDAPQLFLPMTRTTIETLCGRFSKQLIGTPDTIELRGIGEEDVQLAWRRQSFHRWQLFTLNDFQQTVDESLMDAALDGLGVVKVYRYAQPFPMPDGLELLQTIVKYEAVDIGTLLIPPDARGLQYPDARYLGQQLYIIPDDAFPDMRQRGFQVPRSGAGIPDESYTPDSREEMELERDSIHPDAWNEGKVEMVESYEVLTMDDDRREFVVCHWFPNLTVADDGSAVPFLARVVKLSDALPQRVFPRPMWPFFDAKLWPQPRQLRGMNVPDRLEGYQDAINRLAEQMLHLGDITILPLVFANIALTGTLPDFTKLRPGTVVPLDNLGPNGLQIHQPTSNNRHFVEQMQVFRTAAEEDTNVTAFTQGRTASQPNQPRTLGGLALLLQQGNEAYNVQVSKLARQYSDMLRFGYALWQAHDVEGLTFAAPHEAEIEQRLFLGQPAGSLLQTATMQTGDLNGIFDLTIKVNPDAHLEQQKYLSLAERLDAILAPIWPTGRRLLWKMVWERLGLQEFDRLYPEFVAQLQVMTQATALVAQLTQVEMQLLALGQPGQEALQTVQQITQASGDPQAAGQPPQPQGSPLGLPGGASQPQQVETPQAVDFAQLVQMLHEAAGTAQEAAPAQPLASAGVPQTATSALNGG